ncbi:hypothetical protein [Flavobacterium sp. GNP002]|jgi:hypothetical protein
MSKEFNRALKVMARIEQVEQKNKRIKVGNNNSNNNKVFLYVGTFFIMAASLSIGILIVMYFLIKLDGSF